MVARPALTRPALALSIRSAPRLLSLASSRARQSCPQCRRWYSLTPAQEAASSSNSTTIQSEAPRKPLPRLPFRFETGVGLYAKRAPRPFPPPFTSPPSGSFSDALSTHNKNAFVDGELIKGETNGDDAIYKSDYFICANDGVGAWAARPRGHAGLWSRLVLHFWSTAVEENMRAVMSGTNGKEPDPIATLQTAYDKTVAATGAHDWHGTTTACGAQLHYKKDNGSQSPVLYVTNLGDCKVLVIRPSEQSVIYRTTEQWHWFDCPRQMGTNSPDQPNTNAVMDKVDLQVGDVVLAMSDGVIDNLWEHEIMDITVQSIKAWEAQDNGSASRRGGRNGGMQVAANELMAAAQEIALDPFAASPYMEHAIEEGLASEGGKLDDISVVAALCVENNS